MSQAGAAPRRAFALAFVSAVTIGCASTASAEPFVLEEATVASVHAAMRRGDMTCRQLVQRYLDRIDAYDRKGPKLNAILAVNAAALETADKLDAAFKADPSKIGRLHCAPVILKDNFDTADMKTTGASVALKDNQPKADAFTVQRLRNAGAVILAKSNLQELAMGGETVSSLGGQTLNPYDLTRTPGGSSGGTGAAIAANFGLIGTGSDTGQSIRSPSSAQSLVGIRATRGLVSRHGVIPLSSTLDEAGPITRSVEDAARALDAMAGYDPKDPVTAASFGKIPRSYVAYLRPNALRGARIGVARDLFGKGDPHAEVNRVTEQAIKSFAALGAEMIDVTIPNFAKVSGGVFPVMFEMKVVLNGYLGAPDLVTQVRTVEALIAQNAHAPAIDKMLKGAQAMENGLEKPDYAAVFLRREGFRQALLTAMAEQRLDAILYPHQQRLVAKVGEEQLERNGILANGTGFPAVTFPGGFTAPTPDAPIGVPVGIELVGREWSEGRLLGYAYAFEQGTRLRQPPRSTPPLGTP